jgi:DNA-binding XRE family transcriptional regulator
MITITSPEDVKIVQDDLRLSNTKMAKALGVSRQTVSNIRAGNTALTEHMARSISWLITLYRIDPSNPALPDELRRKV